MPRAPSPRQGLGQNRLITKRDYMPRPKSKTAAEMWFNHRQTWQASNPKRHQRDRRRYQFGLRPRKLTFPDVAHRLFITRSPRRLPDSFICDAAGPLPRRGSGAAP